MTDAVIFISDCCIKEEIPITKFSFPEPEISRGTTEIRSGESRQLPENLNLVEHQEGNFDSCFALKIHIQ